MFTIIKTEINSKLDNKPTEQAINIIYGDNEDYVKKWIELYFDNIIKNKNEDDVNYFVEIDNNIYYLIKKYDTLVKGYLYNTPKQVTERIYNIRYLKFNEESIFLRTISNQVKLNEIESINHKVLNEIDRESLYEIYCAFEGVIRTKKTWDTKELVILQDKITRDFKRDLYSTIVKKNKRSKRNVNLNQDLLPCKSIMINENGQLEGCGMVDLSKWNPNACSLEYTILNKD